MKKKLIIVVGPTAVGKTSVAISVAQQLETEIISCDSRQFYQEMGIGTAKPNPIQLKTIPHHFINSHSVKNHVDAGLYGRLGRNLIDKLFEKHDQLVVVGGSGLFIKALVEGFDEMPVIPDEVRNRLRMSYEDHGLGWLQDQVRSADPEYFAHSDQANPHRMLRALEILEAGKKPIHHWQQKKFDPLPYEVQYVGLQLLRSALYERIDQRVDTMMERGLLEEVIQLKPFWDLQALQTVGYSELIQFLKDAYDLEEAIRLIKRNTRHYAKRQLTWFQRNSAIIWFDPSALKDIHQYIGIHG